VGFANQEVLSGQHQKRSEWSPKKRAFITHRHFLILNAGKLAPFSPSFVLDSSILNHLAVAGHFHNGISGFVVLLSLLIF